MKDQISPLEKNHVPLRVAIENLKLVQECRLQHLSMVTARMKHYFKLLNLFSQQQAYSKENFCKPRGPRHTYYYIVVMIVA